MSAQSYHDEAASESRGQVIHLSNMGEALAVPTGNMAVIAEIAQVAVDEISAIYENAEMQLQKTAMLKPLGGEEAVQKLREQMTVFVMQSCQIGAQQIMQLQAHGRRE